MLTCACDREVDRILDLGADGALLYCGACVPAHLALACAPIALDTCVQIEDADDPSVEPIECTLAEFLEANEDGIDPAEQASIVAAVQRGEAYTGGGGAAPAWTIRAAVSLETHTASSEPR